MKLRHVLISAGAALLALTLLPASSASAQENLICIDERTEQVSHGFESTVHHYCNRWLWTPPKASTHTGSGGEHDPIGGKGGGTADRPTCDELKQRLANAKEALDLVNKQLDSANGWLGDALGREATARTAAAQALDAWERAVEDVDFFFTAYATANGADQEIETEMRNGHVLVRPADAFRPNLLLEFGVELSAAMAHEVTTRNARNAAATDYREIGEDLNDARAAVANLTARQAGLSQAIERLQGELGRC